MKSNAFLLSALVLMCGCAAMNERTGTTQAHESAASDLVDRRVAAYNAHDIDAFLATYDENVRIYVYPDRFLGQGRERMRRIFGPQFAKGDGSVRRVAQHVLEDTVVNVEDVTIAGVLERNIAVYTVTNGSIVEVRLIEPGE